MPEHDHVIPTYGYCTPKTDILLDNKYVVREHFTDVLSMNMFDLTTEMEVMNLFSLL